MTFYKFITGFVALGTAACAAFFSVLGIATFLGGNFIEVAIMAGFLEAGKLVCASAAYRFRKVAATWIRGLLVTFTIIMMFITSTGIFGFLSSSYQQAASERDISEQKIENVRSKKQSFETRSERLQKDRQRLVDTQDRLQNLQAEQGWLSQRQDQRLSELPSELARTDSVLSATRDSVLAYEQQITELEANQSSDAKLGPIMFVADTVGLDPDQAALYFILLLIFVFDPMAVTLIVALSMATDEFEETVTEDTKEKEPEQQDGGGGEKVLDYDPIGKKVDISEIRETLGKPLPPQEEEENEINLTAGKIDPDKLRDLSSAEEEQSEEESQPNEEEQSSDKSLSHEFPDQKIKRLASLDESVEDASYEKDVESENGGNNEPEEDVEEDEEEKMSSEVKEWFENARSSTPTTRSEKPWENPFRDNPFGNFDDQQ